MDEVLVERQCKTCLKHKPQDGKYWWLGDKCLRCQSEEDHQYDQTPSPRELDLIEKIEEIHKLICGQVKKE